MPCIKQHQYLKARFVAQFHVIGLRVADDGSRTFSARSDTELGHVRGEGDGSNEHVMEDWVGASDVKNLRTRVSGWFLRVEERHVSTYRQAELRYAKR